MSEIDVMVVVPTWNGERFLAECLASLAAQTQPHRAIVVDNGSVDGSVALVRARFPDVELVLLAHNQGFAGGVNRGIEAALAGGAELVALLNNDAVADERWLEHLVVCAAEHPEAGIVTAKLLAFDREHLDSTGDCYGGWGLPWPRGRGELDRGQFDDAPEVFAASGGASLYRASMLRGVGTFDEAFFAYYEDVDLSFRARLAGWGVRYAPAARAYHRIGGTSAALPDFARFHVLRNLPWLFVKDMPGPLLRRHLPRFAVLYASMLVSGVARGHAAVTLRAAAAALRGLPAVLVRRRRVQALRTVDVATLDPLLDHRLPADQQTLRRVQAQLSPLRWRTGRR